MTAGKVWGKPDPECDLCGGTGSIDLDAEAGADCYDHLGCVPCGCIELLPGERIDFGKKPRRRRTEPKS